MTWIIAAICILGFLVVFFWPRSIGISQPPTKTLKSFLPESKFIKIGDIQIHYVQAGHGQDIVLLHGIGASVFIWRLIFPLLESDFRVTAIDFAGFGKSSKSEATDYGLDAQADLILKMLEGIGIEHAHLVGSSMGGAVALWLAKLAPQRFDRVAALAPAIDQSLVPRIAEYFRTAVPFFRHTINRSSMRLILTRVLARSELISNEVVDAYLAPFLDRGESLRSFWSSLKLLRDPRLPNDLKGLTSRVLVAHGAKDRMVPRRVIDRLIEILPNAKLVTHPEAGHHIMEDEPEWTAKELLNFFALGN